MSTRTRIYRARRLAVMVPLIALSTAATALGTAATVIAAVLLVGLGAWFTVLPVRLPENDKTFGELYREAATDHPHDAA